MDEKIYISVEKEYIDNFEYWNPKNFKKVKEMSFEELKTAYNTRLFEKNKAHPESPFQQFYNEDMIALKDEIKHRKTNNNEKK